MRLGVALVAVFIAAVTAAPSRGADLCFRLRSSAERIDRAEAIFAGTVLSSEWVPPAASHRRRVSVTFQVDRVYRGSVGEKVQVFFESDFYTHWGKEPPYRIGRQYPHVFVSRGDAGIIGDDCATGASLERRSCKERIESIPTPAVRERMKEADFVCVLEMRGLR